MQNVVRDLTGKARLIIKKMAPRMIDHVRLFAMRHCDLGMLVEMIMERARPAFLGAGDEEI